MQGAALGTLGFCTAWAVDADGSGADWVEVVELDLPLENLSQRWRGRRIVHLSDLHCSSTVSGEYLRRCIDRINTLQGDIVVLTGDYTTYDVRGRYREKVAALLGGLESRFGVYACLGNHDYGVRSQPPRKRIGLLRGLMRGMEARGVTVLRNASVALDIEGDPLWLVGLGDLRAADFRPHKAFAGVPADEVAIALIHNPRGIDHLGRFTAHAVMSGHTHGRRTPVMRRPAWTMDGRRSQAGLYDVEGTPLYINRGLGRIGRARLSARPEITIFTLS